MELTNNVSVRTGLAMVLCSFASFCFLTLPFNEVILDDFAALSFFISYGLFIIYLIFSLFLNHRSYGRFYRFRSLENNVILLVLLNISAFSLNKSIRIFPESTSWLTTFILFYNVALLWVALRKDYKSPNPLNSAIVLLLSLAWLFSLYGVFYVLPILPISIPAFLFFGISLHVFVPLWYLVLLTIILKRYIHSQPDMRYLAFGGGAICVGMISLFVWRWSLMQKQLLQYEMDETKNELPSWIQLTQQIPPDKINERILKAGLEYSEIDEFFSWNRFERFNRLKHDPLIGVASMITGPMSLSSNERLKIFTAIFDQRHQTERRLWSGEALSTNQINTTVQLYPAYRLAYTELTLTIQNNAHHQSGSTQEAIYTFHLPEGAVVTSGALWIEGEERPAYLTTKTKADSAYTTIVGRERRDPLLIHWREGNRISVRVFPCTAEEPRKFKLGITSPLQFKNGQLQYNNIDFQGPYWGNAKAKVEVLIEGKTSNLKPSIGMRKQQDKWVYQGRYRSKWRLRLAESEVAPAVFAFNGRGIVAEPYFEQTAPFHPKAIYLDIHSGWSFRLFTQVLEQTNGLPVYVWDGEWKKMGKANQRRLFNRLNQLNYSIFPFHHLPDPEQSLVIGTDSRTSPNLNDLANTQFAHNLNAFMSKQLLPQRVFYLGRQPSNYYRGLKELRRLQLISGDQLELGNLLASSLFPVYPESEQRVLLAPAGVLLKEMEKIEYRDQKVPDHLLRLFAYNDLMRKIGANYFNREQDETAFIAQAEEAFVVSPVSSLIVLETAKDYERFDIKKSKNSLGNAVIKNSGAVPEPGEWVLIVICFGLMVGLWRRLI